MSEGVKLELFEFQNAITPKLVNINAFKNLERLNDARVFNILFGFEDHSFTKKPLEKNGRGAITLLKNLDISYNEWILFTNFIINNRVEGLEEYKKFKDGPKYNGLTHNLNELDKICNKLGGIPIFDKFIEYFYEWDKTKKENKNFMKPEDDKDNDYIWMVYSDTGSSFDYTQFVDRICSPVRGWTCTGNESNIYYFRKPRNIIIPQMGPPNYTPPDTSDEEEIGHEFDEHGMPIEEEEDL
jgi:hypothetical protein